MLILAVFVLPGFVTLLMRERSYAIKGEDSPFERLLSALFYSALIYAIAVGVGWLLGLNERDLSEFYRGEKSLGEDLAAATVIAGILPLALTAVGLRWRYGETLRPRVLKRLGISPAHGVQSAWNDLFGRRGTMFLRVTLTDGRVVGGFYGPGSFAGYSEHAQNLLISQRWELDEEGQWFTKPATDSVGL